MAIDECEKVLVPGLAGIPAAASEISYIDGLQGLLEYRGYPNVEYFSGIVYEKLGIATDLFTPIFAMARVAGYLAHWREQMADNKLFRPTQIYRGSHGRSYEPIEQRG